MNRKVIYYLFLNLQSYLNLSVFTFCHIAEFDLKILLRVKIRSAFILASLF